jgi:hypothetical protein
MKTTKSRPNVASCHVISSTNLDCGGKRRATPLFRMRVYHRMSPVIRKRRRRPMIGTSGALSAQSKKNSSTSGYFKTSCVCRPLLVAPTRPAILSAIPSGIALATTEALATAEAPRATAEALRRRMARNTQISPKQTHFKTALKYPLINNLRNIFRIFSFKNKPNFSTPQGGLAKEKYFPNPASGLKLQQTDLDKTKLEKIRHRHKLELPKL